MTGASTWPRWPPSRLVVWWCRHFVLGVEQLVLVSTHCCVGGASVCVVSPKAGVVFPNLCCGCSGVGFPAWLGGFGGKRFLCVWVNGCFGVLVFHPLLCGADWCLIGADWCCRLVACARVLMAWWLVTGAGPLHTWLRGRDPRVVDPVPHPAGVRAR